MIPAMMPAYIDEKGGWKVWCPYCGCLHGHGAEPGYRCPPCCSPGSPYHELPRGYYLIPTGQPLPPEAKRLHRRGEDRHFGSWENPWPKPYTPPPVPEWGKPITDYHLAWGLMIEWTYQTQETMYEREAIMTHFDQAWAWFAGCGERQEKLQEMNSALEVFTECLRDVLTFDE